MADNTTYPKIPEKNWWAIRAQFRRSMPPAVTGSYLKSLLDLTSDKAASNLLAPLKQMKLIDDEGKPTDRANEWRDDNKYSLVCEQITAEIYPPEIRSLYPGPDFDKDKIAQWFMTTAKLGEPASKMVASMFVLLSSKEIKTDTNNSNTNAGKSTKKATQKKNDTTQKNVGATIQVTPDTHNNPPTPTPTNGHAPTPTLHIDLQIHISPDASNEQIDNIFASIAKHLYKVNQ